MTRTKGQKNRAEDSAGPADGDRQPDKPSYFRRLGNTAKDVGHLGQTLVKEPKAFPKKTAHTLRPWIRRVWKARGGGLYACGFVVTFLYLEVTTLISEVFESEGVVDFFTSQIFEFAFRFASESIQNMVYAFIWPAFVVQYRPPLGVLMLIAMYFVFTRLIKEPLTRWLFHEEK